MIGALKDLAKRHWPRLRLRTILLAVLLFAAAMPGISAIFLRVYENTLVRQTEAELVAQGAALAALAAVQWPGGGGAAGPGPSDHQAPDYYRPEPTSVDLRGSPILPERPPPDPGLAPLDDAAVVMSRALAPVFDRTTQTTLASAVFLDRRGQVVIGEGRGGSLADLPEVRSALGGRPQSVLRRNGDYHPTYSLEWLSRASGIRLHHARPVQVGDQVMGVILLSRSPRALFRGIYEDRGKIALGAAGIFGLLILLSGLVSRGVTRPIEALSAASRDVAAGKGLVPETPSTAAIEIQTLYEDFRVMAQAIDRRSGYLRDFAAAVSHEFKTPLAGIGGAVELLQDHGETMQPEERRRFLENIAADNSRLSQLVTRLLDLARADMARPGADLNVDVAGPIRRAADAAQNDSFQVEVESPPVLPAVGVPAASLDTVLSVLLQNSRQAGAGRATISASAMPAAVVVEVVDDGPGVPAPDRARLFEPFFTTQRAQGGTGLGLSIARSLLAADNATIELLDAPAGARFVVTLPRADLGRDRS
ncbi:MAG: HAMP domain-containing sensor histidine kinase [Pseudomonadota bacterium]|uniref:sensor histidine kinase n=1 Tax=Phenylobacterium sp. TaxID=1871053 RepID=UPI0025DB21BF|nr:HAMP domain-containing sensor histidine kinase [Phenylobacterium sp.]